ncbi:ABC transporter ATP-binding protein [Cellulomonas sp. URHD0024]|uniref:ABC transporter ATP-binding protein n=1 Tax=Cellulomonas sp. URHD0024 TaxID=1302620 RepID=UPI000408A02C|nr:ABC transporter ATP-binding protein [Cellulomonas sp. URHD0024]
MADDDIVLSLRDVTITNTADGAHLVRGVDLTLRRGAVLGIVGESGSGKTLTCRAVLGILPPRFEVSGGEIDLLGEDVAGLSARDWQRLRGTEITAVFQDPASYLNPSIRVGKQIAEVVRVKKRVSRKAAQAEALALLDAVRLRNPARVYDQYPHELSGGMLQRVLIATAVALDPQILIADEATTALDVTVQAEILDLLLELKERTGLSLIVVSHDLAVVAQLCDEVLVMRGGEIVERGRTDDILFDPQHEYTRLLIDEHNRYGLDRFLTLGTVPDEMKELTGVA